MAAHIEADLYRQVVNSIPIVCVDLIIKRDAMVLLVKRTNEPLRGEWWVPGGRILKNESVLEAARRKSWSEVGLVLIGPKFMGYYEDEYFTSNQGVPCHCISLVFEAIGIGNVQLNHEADEWKFWHELPERLVRKTVWTTSPTFHKPDYS